MTDQNPFGPEARARRRLARLQRFAGAFATSPMLPGNRMDGPLDRGKLPTEAIRLAQDFMGQFSWPILPTLVYRGIRTATRDENTPAIEADAHVILSAHMLTLTGCRREVEVPIVVRAGRLLEPSVMVVDGIPRILSQSLVDELVRQGTFQQKVDPRGGMFAPPLDNEAFATFVALDDAFKIQDRYSRGLYSVAERKTAQAPAGRQAGPCRGCGQWQGRHSEGCEFADLPHEVVRIEYGTVKNKNEARGDWLPMVWEDGRESGDTYASRGYDEDEALARAKQEAEEMASKYVGGDWNVQVTERQASKTAQQTWQRGDRVSVDGDEAVVKECYPEGSSSYMFPHCKVDLVDGDRNVAVPLDRVKGLHAGEPQEAQTKRDEPACPQCGGWLEGGRRPDGKDCPRCGEFVRNEDIKQWSPDTNYPAGGAWEDEDVRPKIGRRAQSDPQVDVQGSGDWTVYWETESPKTIHRHQFQSKRQAIEEAKRVSLESGGYVSVMKGGIDVAEVYGGEVKTSRRAQRYDPGARVTVGGEAARVIEQVHEPTGNGAWDGTYRVEFQDGRTDVVPESKLSVDQDRQTLRHVEAQSGACATCGTQFGRYIPGYHPETGSRCTRCAECPARWKTDDGNLCDGCKQQLGDVAATPLEPMKRYDDCRACGGDGCQACDFTGLLDRQGRAFPSVGGDAGLRAAIEQEIQRHAQGPAVVPVEPDDSQGCHICKGTGACPQCQGAGCDWCRATDGKCPRCLGSGGDVAMTAAREGDGQPAQHNESRKEDDFSAGAKVEFVKSFRARTRGGPSYLVESGTSATVVRDMAEDGTTFEVRLEDGSKVMVPRETLRRASREADSVYYPGDPGRYRCARCGTETPANRLVTADTLDATQMACPRCYGLDLDRIAKAAPDYLAVRSAAATVDQVVREVEGLKDEGYDDVSVLLSVSDKYPDLAEAVMQAARDKGLLDLDGE